MENERMGKRRKRMCGRTVGKRRRRRRRKRRRRRCGVGKEGMAWQMPFYKAIILQWISNVWARAHICGTITIIL